MLQAVRAFHVCRTDSRSGVARYALDFHEHVLEPLGYELVAPRDVTPAWLAGLSGGGRDRAVFHVQLGAMQFDERRALSALWRAGFAKVDATLHDPPFLTFPYFAFGSELATRLSRGFDWYLGSLGIQARALRRLRRVYVLTEKGRRVLVARGAADVRRIPHVVRPAAIHDAAATTTQDALYFGFIGPAKGLDYALRLHERILDAMPSVRLHVVGEAVGARERAYLDACRARYRRNVVFHGYVEEERLDGLFAAVRHVFLPFEPHPHVHAASGSLVNALRRGRVVWTTGANAVAEIVEHGRNGLMLARDVDADAAAFVRLAASPAALDAIAGGAIETARAMAAYPYAGRFVEE